MTYSNWREELSEGKVKLARALIRGLPAMVRNKPVRSIVSRVDDVGVTKGVRGFLQSLKDYDGTTKLVRKSSMQYNRPKAIVTNTPIDPVTNKPFKLIKSPRTGKTGRVQRSNFKGEYTDLPVQPYDPLNPNTSRPTTLKSGSLRRANKSGLTKDLKKIDAADKLNLLQTGEADILKNMRKSQYQQLDKSNTKKAIDAVKEKYPFLKSGNKKDLKKKPKNTKPDSYIDPRDGKEYDIPEQVAVAALKGGSKLIPALMTGIGAAGMIMQSKKSKGPFADTGGFDASKSRTKRQYFGLPPSSDLTKQQKKDRKIKGQQEIIKKRDDKIAKEGPGDLVPGAKRERLKKLLKKYLEKSGIKAKRDANKKIDRNLGKKVDESVAALAVGGSKLIPALMTGIGAAGTILQAKRKRQLSRAEKRLHDREMNVRDNDMIRARRGEADKQNKLIDKYEKKYKSQKEKNIRKNVMKGLKGGEVIQDEIDFVQYVKDRFKKKGLSGFIRPRKIEKKKKTIGDLLKNINTNTNEEMMAAPTNSVGGGQIAGTVEAGDNPPVKRKKRYIYGGTGSRKMWMNNK